MLDCTTAWRLISARLHARGTPHHPRSVLHPHRHLAAPAPRWRMLPRYVRHWVQPAQLALLAAVGLALSPHPLRESIAAGGPVSDRQFSSSDYAAGGTPWPLVSPTGPIPFFTGTGTLEIHLVPPVDPDFASPIGWDPPVDPGPSSLRTPIKALPQMPETVVCIPEPDSALLMDVGRMLPRQVRHWVQSSCYFVPTQPAFLAAVGGGLGLALSPHPLGDRMADGPISGRQFSSSDYSAGGTPWPLVSPTGSIPSFTGTGAPGIPWVAPVDPDFASPPLFPIGWEPPVDPGPSSLTTPTVALPQTPEKVVSTPEPDSALLMDVGITLILVIRWMRRRLPKNSPAQLKS